MADEISDRKSPGFWFYTADFERDMQILPLAAQGLWIRMMCWASDNEEHRGFLELPTGQPMTDIDIAHRVGKPIREVRNALDAMKRLGTFSEDSRGCIFSRRMARDTHISSVRKQAALKRADIARRATGEFAPRGQVICSTPRQIPLSELVSPDGSETSETIESSKQPNFAGAKRPAKPEQNPAVTASVSDSASTIEEEPPKPPAPPALELVPANGASRKRGKRTAEEIRKALGPEREKWWDAFWKVFPSKESPTPGMDAFERKVKTREMAVELFKGAERYAALARADPQMKLKYAQGWINDERYKDECRIPPTPSNGHVSSVMNRPKREHTEEELIEAHRVQAKAIKGSESSEFSINWLRERGLQA